MAVHRGCCVNTTLLLSSFFLTLYCMFTDFNSYDYNDDLYHAYIATFLIEYVGNSGGLPLSIQHHITLINRNVLCHTDWFFGIAFFLSQRKTVSTSEAYYIRIKIRGSWQNKYNILLSISIRCPSRFNYSFNSQKDIWRKNTKHGHSNSKVRTFFTPAPPGKLWSQNTLYP